MVVMLLLLLLLCLFLNLCRDFFYECNLDCFGM